MTVFNKNEGFWQKITIFDNFAKNAGFLQKWLFLTKMTVSDNEITISDKNDDFWQKCGVLTKITISDENDQKVGLKLQLFDKNEDFW